MLHIMWILWVFYKHYAGPANTPYEKGHWVINLYIPDQYPYKSPSVGFLNKIYHPNIDFGSGSVCLDVLNQTWSSYFQLVNIFEIFLPQLLTYPNPSSPLNHEAAEIFKKNVKEFNKKVREYIIKYSLNKSLKEQPPVVEKPQISQEQSSFSEGSCSLSDQNSILDEDDELRLYLSLYIFIEKMIKKPDLRIDTEFFDDNLNGIHIPQAIRVTQSIDTQTFIKEGLNDEEMDGSRLMAIEIIEKVLSQRFFLNFVECWGKLKSNQSQQSFLSSPYSHKVHKRQKSLARDTSNDIEINTSHTQFRGLSKQRPRFNHIRINNIQQGAIEWLEQQKRIIKQKSVYRGRSLGKVMAAETHYQRAKVLKQIVEKLKHGRQLVTGLVNQFDNKRENEQIYLKLNKLERLMIDVHSSQANRAPITPQKQLISNSNHQKSRNPPEDHESELTNRLKLQLMEVKNEMQKIRRTNQQILKEQQWKKAEILKMTSTRQQIQQQYETLRHQMSYLQKEKQTNQMNTTRLQHELSQQNFNRQEYERQISYLSQRINEAEARERERERISKETQRSIALKTNNTFGYSTFTTSQKYGEPIVNKMQQSEKLLKSAPPSLPLNEQARESADKWACC